VSPEILPLVTAAGFTWLATDDIPAAAWAGRSATAAISSSARTLYRPYRVLPAETPHVVFRDHEPSDRTDSHRTSYRAGREVSSACSDRSRLHDRTPYLVSVILMWRKRGGTARPLRALMPG
jgi:hypothetical protein